MRVEHGVYDTGLPNRSRHQLDVKRLRTVWLALLLYMNAAIIGVGALVMHGIWGVPHVFVPELTLPGAQYRRPRAGVRVRQVRVLGETVEIDGRHVAVAPLALAQARPVLDPDDWVACMDNALNRGIISDVEGVLRRLNGIVGTRSLPDLMPLVDGRSESPVETRVRLRAHRAGIGPDTLQRNVFTTSGRFLGRADLAWHLGSDRWLLVEVDGNEFHRTDAQLASDATRQNGLLADGRHQILRYRNQHLTEPDRMIDEIRTILDREGWRPGRAFPPDPLTASCRRG